MHACMHALKKKKKERYEFDLERRQGDEMCMKWTINK